MAITEIGQLHSRYVRLSDKFRALWTYNQFATGVYKNVLRFPLPYNIDFPAIYDSIRRASDIIQSASAMTAMPIMEEGERELQRIVVPLVEADQLITPPVLRRFLDQLKRRDDKKVIFYLIKFYLYGDSVDGDQRDKLDFLFTRIGEDYFEARGEYWSKDPGELRKQIESLVAVRPVEFTDSKEIVRLVNAMRTLKAEIQQTENFETLTDSHLLDDARALKHRMGNYFFHPDVLIAVIDCNVTTRNRFLRYYSEEEHHLIDDSQRLVDNEEAIARGFGESNPGLMQEIANFRQLKQEFEESRANFNVKHNLIAQLKTSMNSILGHLDRVVPAPADQISEERLVEEHRLESVRRIFGEDSLLDDYLVRIYGTLESLDDQLEPEQLIAAPEMADLRLEPWEAAAYRKLYRSSPMEDSENEELLQLYLRAASLRIKITEEASFLAAFPPQRPVQGTLMQKVKESLDRANTYDQYFVTMLHDEIHYSDSKNVHRLYRSRFRLLRVFSGLWLIYDHFT
jgi:hypothetical protein